MNLRDLITSAIRTAMQAVAGWLILQLLKIGVEIDGATLEAALFALATGFATMVLNKLQSLFPWLGSLLSLGRSQSTPTYS